MTRPKVKAVLFRHTIELQTDGSSNPVQGMHKDRVERMEFLDDGLNWLLIVTKRTFDHHMIPKENIAGFTIDDPEAQVVAMAIATEKAELQTQQDAASRQQAVIDKAIEEATKPKKRRTINDL